MAIVNRFDKIRIGKIKAHTYEVNLNNLGFWNPFNIRVYVNFLQKKMKF